MAASPPGQLLSQQADWLPGVSPWKVSSRSFALSRMKVSYVTVPDTLRATMVCSFLRIAISRVTSPNATAFDRLSPFRGVASCDYAAN